VSVAVVRRVAPDIGYGWSGADRQLVRAILSFSSALSINQIASRLASRTDTIVIGIAQSAASVTPYALALRVGQLVLLLTSQFTKVLMPLAADINARDDRARLRNVLVASTRIALAIGAGVGVTAIVLGGAILAAWVGDRYSRYSTIVTIIAAGGIVSAASLAAANILLAIGRQRVLATLSLANGLANLLLSIVLVLSYGIVGAAIGTLAAESAFALVLLPYTARVVGVTIPELMRDAVARVLVPAAALFAVLELVTRVVDPSSPVPLVAVAGAGLVFYALVYVVAAASETERAFYVRITSRTLRRLKVR
jgi:O-antigen/teichoic acid export membrane protein